MLAFLQFNPMLAVGAQLFTVLVIPFLVWVFRGVFSEKLDKLVEHMRKQEITNAVHESQTGHIIEKVDRLHAKVDLVNRRVDTLERHQFKTNIRQVLIGEKLGVEFKEDE